MATTITLRVEGMHCGSCGLLIDDALEELPGVIRSGTRLREGRTVVEIEPDSCTPDQLVAAVAEAGYTASVLPP